MTRKEVADYVGIRHFADLYAEDDGVIPTCQCGWEISKVPTYDEAAEAYALHRIDTLPPNEEVGDG